MTKFLDIRVLLKSHIVNNRINDITVTIIILSCYRFYKGNFTQKLPFFVLNINGFGNCNYEFNNKNIFSFLLHYFAISI